MKRLIIFCIILCGSLMVIYAQEHYIYVNGEKHYFEISPNKIIVQFDEEATVNLAKNIIQKNTSYQLSNIAATDHKGLNLIAFSNTDKTTITQLVKQWKNKDAILYSGHVFVDKQGKEIAAITNQIIVRLKKEDDFPVLQKNIMFYGIAKAEQNEFDSRTYLLRINNSSQKDAMQIANELHEKGVFEYVEPNLLLFINYETNDTYYPQQWALDNTGQYGGSSGTDINANQAWTITTGSSNAKVAILDNGLNWARQNGAKVVSMSFGTWNDAVGYGLVNAYAAVLAASCINNFTNQIVDSNITVTGCNSLNVQNVTVSNNSKLILEAPDAVLINASFEIQAGASLEIQ